MALTIAVRREDKNKWERRVPIIPNHVKELKQKFGIEVLIQPSDIRAFTNGEYQQAGANVKEDITDSLITFAVKEMPDSLFQPDKTYIFFSHVIKGQEYNMPMLKKLMALKCNLIDYEKIVDDKGFRLVFFGRYAGLAGMIDTLWSLGRKLNASKIDTPFKGIKQTVHYKDLDEVKLQLKAIGERIANDGLPDALVPLVVGFAGYGNVSKGAQEILDLLPVTEITPGELECLKEDYSNRTVYKVVFKESDMVAPIDQQVAFSLQDYYENPEKYRSCFEKYISSLSILMNCFYWDQAYPRLISKEQIGRLYRNDLKLKVIGDISVDINGAIEFTEKSTSPDSPSFVYHPLADTITDELADEGIVVMAVDNLPCELPRESSTAFSDSLFEFIPKIVKTDFTVDFDQLTIPQEIKRAMILHHGKLTPDYEYIKEYL